MDAATDLEMHAEHIDYPRCRALCCSSLCSINIVVERSRTLPAAAAENPRAGNSAAATQAIRFLFASILRRPSAVGHHRNGKQTW